MMVFNQITDQFLVGFSVSLIGGVRNTGAIGNHVLKRLIGVCGLRVTDELDFHLYTIMSS